VHRLIINFNLFRGPNVHAPRQLVRISIDFTGAAHDGGAKLPPAFMETLYEHLPALRDDPELTDAAGDGEQQVCRAFLSSISFILESAGQRVDLREMHHSDAPRQYHILLNYVDEQIAVSAAGLATRLIHQLVQRFVDPSVSTRPNFSFAREYDELLTFGKNRQLGNFNLLIVEEADRRGIPWHRIGQDTVQLGQGHYQKRFAGNYTDRTPMLSIQLSSNKYLTNQLLRESCLPMPRQRAVTNKGDAARAAEGLGFPVVVKPMSADYGRGVAVGLDTAAEVETAFDNARKFAPQVIVETFIPGNDYRLLVIDGKFVAAAQRVHAHIVGDGRATVTDLIEQENIRRQPKPSEIWSLRPLLLDGETDRFLRKVGMTKTSVPEPGQQVFIRGTANIKTGGTSMHATDRVHPDVRAMAVDAAAAVELDIAGIDYLTPDISRSYRDVGGAICEVNCRPGPDVHALAGGDGLSRIINAQLDYLFPEGSAARISTLAVLGGELGTLSAHMIAEIMDKSGRTTGVASENKIFINKILTTNDDLSGARSARTLPRHPKIDTAIFDLTLNSVIEEGLFSDATSVSVIADPLGNGQNAENDTEKEIASPVHRLLVDVADKAIVLSADNPVCGEAVGPGGPKDICIVANDEEDNVAQKFISAGHSVVTKAVLDGKTMIVVHAGGNAEPMIETSEMTQTAGISGQLWTEAAMYAVATSHVMGISPTVTRDALAGFRSPPGL
jgi:cyanophycin synthetase